MFVFWIDLRLCLVKASEAQIRAQTDGDETFHTGKSHSFHFSLQPHGEEADGDQERGEADA